MYYYKARLYSPTLGRFLQTDPIGYADDMNLYAYVGSNPLNRIDPLGLSSAEAAMLSGTSLGPESAAGAPGANPVDDSDVFEYFADAMSRAGDNVTALGPAGPEMAIPFKAAAIMLRGVKVEAAAAEGAVKAGQSLLPKGITQIKNAKGEVFKEVHTPPSKPHAGMVEHTHPNYRNVLPDGTVRTGVSNNAIPVSRQDIIDATRPGAQRTGAP